MKKVTYFIIAVIAAMAVFMNNANAEVVLTTQSQDNVSDYARKAIPDVTADEVKACYNAVKNGGEYNIERKKVKITCSEEEMIVFRRFF